MIDWTKLRERLVDPATEGLHAEITFPCLPEAVIECMRIARRPDAEIDDLATAIERDPGLVVELLRQVNSAAFGLRGRASSVRHAVSLLGVRRTSLFVSTVAGRKLLEDCNSPLLDARRFAVESMERALFARVFADALGADVDVAFATALLQNVTLPILVSNRQSQYAEMAPAQDSGRPLCELEVLAFGWDHATMAAAMMHSWEFPDEVVCGVALHHRMPDVLDDLRLRGSSAFAVALSGCLPGWESGDTLDEFDRHVVHLPKLDVELTARLVAKQLEVEFPGDHEHVTLCERLEAVLR